MLNNFNTNSFVKNLVEIQENWTRLNTDDIINAIRYYRENILPNLPNGAQEVMIGILNHIEFQTDIHLEKCIECGKIYRPKKHEMKCEKCG